MSFGIAELDACLGGGLATGALHEIRCAGTRDAGAAAGFALCLLGMLARHKPGGVLWVRDPAAGDGGALFPSGLRGFGLDPQAFAIVAPRSFDETLWAAGEAAGTAGLSAMVLEIRGNPARLDLTATRQLALRAQASGALALILRLAGEAESSAIRTRFLLAPASSEPDAFYHRGVGPMRLGLTLEKNRHGRTGRWTLAWNNRTGRFDHAADPAPSLAPAHSLRGPDDAGHGPDRPHDMGQVVAFGRAS